MESFHAAVLALALIGTLCNGAALICVIKRYSFTIGLNRRGVLSITVADTMCCLMTVVTLILQYCVVAPPHILGASIYAYISSTLNNIFLMASEWSKLCFIITVFISIKQPLQVFTNFKMKKQICISLLIIWAISFIIPTIVAVAAPFVLETRSQDQPARIVMLLLWIPFVIMVLPGIISLTLLFALCFLIYKANKKHGLHHNGNGAMWVQHLYRMKFTLLKCLIMSIVSTGGSPTLFAVLLYYYISKKMVPQMMLILITILAPITFIISPLIFALKPQKLLFSCKKYFHKTSTSMLTDNTELQNNRMSY